MKQLSIFDFEAVPDAKFKKGDRAKVRKPNEKDDHETQAVLGKYGGEKVVVVGSYFSEHYREWCYLLSFLKENASTYLKESDII